jgi:hypothetical protein
MRKVSRQPTLTGLMERRIGSGTSLSRVRRHPVRVDRGTVWSMIVFRLGCRVHLHREVSDSRLSYAAITYSREE